MSIERKTVGRCVICDEIIGWDENYVRMFITSDKPEHDYEIFAHLDCHNKQIKEGANLPR